MPRISFKLLFAACCLAVLGPGCTTSNPTQSLADAPFRIVHTELPGCLWNDAHARAKIISQDGGESFAVPGGAIWAFGDTFKGSRAADGAPHYAGGAESCTIAFLPTNASFFPPTFEYLVSTNGAMSPFDYFTNEPPARFRIWPLGGVYLNGQSYLFYSLIEIFGPGSWDFRGVGSGLARSAAPLGHYDRLRPKGDWHFPVAPTQVLAADGWLYLYEIADTNRPQGVILARARQEKIEDPTAYEFYAGPGPHFSTRKTDAAILVHNIPGQVSVAWNACLGKYIMASSSDLLYPREIRFLVADAPYGPWSAPVARVQMPARLQGKRVDLIYCAYFHPEVFRDNGRVMNLTVSTGLKDAGFDSNCEMLEVEIKPRR